MRNIVKNKVNTINALATDIYYGIYFYQYDMSLGDPKFYDYDYNMKPLQQSTEQLGQDMLFPKIAEILGLKYLDDDFPQRFYCKIAWMINVLDKKLMKEDLGLSFYEKALTNLLLLVLPQEADIFAELSTIDGKLKYLQQYLKKYKIQPPDPQDLEGFGSVFPDRVLKRFLTIQGLEECYEPVQALISITITQQQIQLCKMLFPQMTTGININIQPRPKSPPKVKEPPHNEMTDSQTKRVNDTVQKNKDKLRDFIPKIAEHHSVVAPKRLVGLHQVEEYQYDRLSGTIKLKTVYLPAHEAQLRTLGNIKVPGFAQQNGNQEKINTDKQTNNSAKHNHFYINYIANNDGFIQLKKLSTFD